MAGFMSFGSTFMQKSLQVSLKLSNELLLGGVVQPN